MFIYNLSQYFLLDKKDIFVIFLNLSQNNNFSDLYNNYKFLNITKLEIIRITKFINYILHHNIKCKDLDYDDISEYQDYI